MKRNVAIVFGGDSGEFDVSVRSGEVVFKHLDNERFNGYPILMKGGRWMYTDPSGMEHPIDKNDFTLETGSGKVAFDVVFNAIHGTPGEDGKLQGYLEMLRIPVTSCDSITSAITFNKYFCNRFVSTFGVNIARSVVVSRETDHMENALSGLKFPVFVKPNCGGSSVGTSKVNDGRGLADAISFALKEDTNVLVEEFIPGREITCGVITWKGKTTALPITEIVSKKEFFDYEAKYLGMSEEITPARIPEEVSTLCQETSVMLYEKLSCRGMVRCDYIFNETGLYFLEVNTVPGLSEASIVPQQARETGISLKELFTEVILGALARP
jgi:D-alanine-D-alanine ligase